MQRRFAWSEPSRTKESAVPQQVLSSREAQSPVPSQSQPNPAPAPAQCASPGKPKPNAQS